MDVGLQCEACIWGLDLNVELVVVVFGCDLWYFLVGEQCVIEFRFGI